MATAKKQLDPRITEHRNPRTAAIDLASPMEIVELLLAEDRTIVDAVATQRASIARAIEIAERTFRAGGRMFYLGAGTSGRLGVLDAAECPPTFGTDPQMVQGILAGGDAALRRPQEGAEDRGAQAKNDVAERDVDAKDFLIGIAASGTTPYVRAGIEEAMRRGAATGIVACSPPPDDLLRMVDVAIVAITGPEAIAGSTRLKAGTATKMIVNIISTGAMVRLGKTFGNLMVDLRATSRKLEDRGERILMEVCGVDREEARRMLDAAQGRVKIAIVMRKLGVGRDEAMQRLDEAAGAIRRVTHEDPPPV